LGKKRHKPWLASGRGLQLWLGALAVGYEVVQGSFRESQDKLVNDVAFLLVDDYIFGA